MPRSVTQSTVDTPISVGAVVSQSTSSVDRTCVWTRAAIDVTVFGLNEFIMLGLLNPKSSCIPTFLVAVVIFVEYQIVGHGIVLRIALSPKKSSFGVGINSTSEAPQKKTKAHLYNRSLCLSTKRQNGRHLYRSNYRQHLFVGELLGACCGPLRCSMQTTTVLVEHTALPG